jgi:hypothetical protein
MRIIVGFLFWSAAAAPFAPEMKASALSSLGLSSVAPTRNRLGFVTIGIRYCSDISQRYTKIRTVQAAELVDSLVVGGFRKPVGDLGPSLGEVALPCRFVRFGLRGRFSAPPAFY